MTAAILDAALYYHRQGLVVIPLRRCFKVPRDGAWQKEDRQTEARVRELFATHDGNIGIACGSVSRLVVVDIDTKKGKDGFADLAAWEAKHGKLPSTFTTATPSGGQHRWYRLPEGRRVQKSKVMGPGIDVMGDVSTGASQIVAPPSVLIGDTDPSGKPQTPGPYPVVVNAPIANWPAHLLDLLPESKLAKGPAEPIDWKPVPPDDPTYAQRVAFQREQFAKETLYLQGESDKGVFRYVLMLRRLGPGLLLDADTTFANYAECYDSRLPDEHKWLPAHTTEFVNGPLRRAYETQPDKGAFPDGTWRMEGRFFGSSPQPIASASPLPTPSPPQAPTPTPNPPAPPPDADAWGLVDWEAQDPPVAWVADGVVQEATVTTAFGLPNSLKTWTMYLLAACVAKGEPWLGRKTKKGLVVILDYESSPRQARRRMKVLKQQGLTGIVRYLNPKELLTDGKLWDRLDELKPVLIVVDSLSRGMLGEDENDVAIAAPLDFAKRIARSCGAATIFIHHKNKSGKEGQASARGSNAIVAASEGWLEFLDFERLSGNVQRARLHCDRLKEAVSFEDITLELSDEKGLVEAQAPKVAGAQARGDDLTVDNVKTRLLLHITNAGAEGIGEKALLRQAGLTTPEGARTGKKALGEMVDEDVEKVPMRNGCRYRRRKSAQQQKADILQVMAAGVGSEAEILSKSGSDKQYFGELAKDGHIYRIGGVWVVTAKQSVTGTGGY